MTIALKPETERLINELKSGYYKDAEDMHVEPFTTQQTVRDVRQLTQAYQLTVYDAAYLELALRYNLPLATLDIELKQASFAVGVRLIA